MTRINVVPVEELCDEHLRAEFREIVRVPKIIKRREYTVHGMPEQYTVRTSENPSGGIGHVKFFYDKLGYLKKRYESLKIEMQKRGFKTNIEWVESNSPFWLHNDYQPTPEALALNRKRLKERMPKIPHYKRERSNHE